MGRLFFVGTDLIDLVIGSFGAVEEPTSSHHSSDFGPKGPRTQIIVL